MRQVDASGRSGLTLDDGDDGALLDGRGALETVGVDACAARDD